MSFAELTMKEQKEALCRLHSILNDGLFNGRLKQAFPVPCVDELDENTGLEIPDDTIMVNIGRAGKRLEFSAKACFIHPDESIFNYPDESICFDVDYIRYMLVDCDENEQRIDLGTVMLHEMIHQYIFEKGIKDNSPHGRIFKQCCKKHGLIRIPFNVGDGQWKHEESLSPEVEKAINGFYF